ncbi:zinc finger BED domain-containing protein 4-like [Prorops nasuta]|uniref:zinc finger BED domain-containing protein 4-like n=1 Tax=Prorops nasuta TaxID=863751 RepID=UPI0034CE8DD8
MLERFLELSTAVSAIILHLPESPPMLSASEIQMIRAIVTLLRPLEKSTKELSAEHFVSASKVIPIINCLRAKLKDLNLQTDVGKKMCCLLKHCLESRFVNIEYNNILAVATILDPRFKLLHFTNDKALAKAISFIKTELRRNSDEIVATTATSTSVSGIDVAIPDEADDLWSYHKKLLANENKIINNNQQSSENMPMCLQYYLNFATFNLETNPISFWNKYFGESHLNLKQLAMKYLPITSTSVPAERLFSKAGNIMTDARNRLSSKHLHELLFLNSLGEEVFF